MRFEIAATGTYACRREPKELLEKLGFQFSPPNIHGIYVLVGPVTFRTVYGWEQCSVTVDITTLEDMLVLLQTLGSVCVDWQHAASDGDFHFFMWPLAEKAD